LTTSGIKLSLSRAAASQRSASRKLIRSMTQAQQALAAIQAYGAPAPTEDDHTPTRRLWEAVIQGAEGYDEEATAQVDPSHTNAEAVFADGSRLWWNAALQAWETGPASAQRRVGEIRSVRPLL
jgi:hypothetical protein